MHYFCSTIIDGAVNTYINTTIEVIDGSSVCIGSCRQLLERLLPEGRRIIVITDATIDRLYRSLLEPYECFVIGVGESGKTLHTAAALYRKLIETEADRSCFVLGVGGGVVTDIAGFVASTYMRGLEFGFVSTTLLGQVDAAVGGKNGVNVDGFKNMVGTFNQPKFAICDTEMLKTLPEREFRAGLAEVIKAAVIADTELFELLENSSPAELRGNGELLSRVVTSAVKVKIGIVSRDACEKGERRKLNLGHTVGHAIEKCSHTMNHGEAVAAGMAAAVRMAEVLKVLPSADGERILRLLERYGFDLTLPATPRRLANAILKDKKITGDTLNMILPEGIGSCRIFAVPKSEIGELLCKQHKPEKVRFAENP
ncbi:MAG: 3-dehydroquinate synthase [Alistipes sp.]|nr:3-dehydroquinate synthase [Alistipes sp.]